MTAIANALPLPSGTRQFIYVTGVDANGEPLAGKPLAGGSVAYYFPGGTNPKDTYQDYLATIINDNPITLPPSGQWPIWGNGRYREIVKDALGNTQWDLETAVLATQPYEVGFYYFNTPSAGDTVMTWNFVQSVTFPTGFVGSIGAVTANPSALATFNITQNGSAIGEMLVSTGGLVTFTSGLTPSFQAGDKMTVIVSGGGANGAAGIGATFLGTLQQ